MIVHFAFKGKDQPSAHIQVELCLYLSETNSWAYHIIILRTLTLVVILNKKGYIEGLFAPNGILLTMTLDLDKY